MLDTGDPIGRNVAVKSMASRENTELDAVALLVIVISTCIPGDMNCAGISFTPDDATPVTATVDKVRFVLEPMLTPAAV